MDWTTWLYLLSHLVNLIPASRERPIYAYREGDRVVICIVDAPDDLLLRYIDVEGYHIQPTYLTLYGEIQRREDGVYIKKGSGGAVVVQPAGSAGRVALVSDKHIYTVKIGKRGSCPHVRSI